MSLIQEALKRKENDEAQRKQEAEGSGNPPVTLSPGDAGPSASPEDSPLQSMPVLPSSPPSTAGQSIRRKVTVLWVIAASVVVLIAVVLVGGFASSIYRILSPVKMIKTGQWAQKTGVTTGGTNITISRPLPVGSEMEETANGVKATTPPAVAPPPEKSPAVTAAQKTELDALTQPQQATAEAGPKSAPAGVKVPAKTPVAFKWPVLKLKGILRGTGPAESTAIINGKMIGVGQTIADVTIVEIQADGVLLKSGSETRFLRVGATLY